MKNTIMGLIIGICLAVTGFHVWFYYNLARQVSANTQTIAQVVTFINEGLKAQQGATPAKK
jgi:cell division protein FtsB